MRPTHLRNYTPLPAPLRKLNKGLRAEALLCARRGGISRTLAICHFCSKHTTWLMYSDNVGVMPRCDTHMPKIRTLPYIAFRFFEEEVEHQRIVVALERE